MQSAAFAIGFFLGLAAGVCLCLAVVLIWVTGAVGVKIHFARCGLFVMWTNRDGARRVLMVDNPETGR